MLKLLFQRKRAREGMQAIVKEVITDPEEKVGVSGRCERHTARERVLVLQQEKIKGQ